MAFEKAVTLAVLVPLLGYSPFLLGNFLPVWLNIFIFIGGLVAGMAITAYWAFAKLPKKRLSQVLGYMGLVLYTVIIVGLVDIVSLTSGVGPFIVTGGEGWANLIAFVSWAIFIVPVCYIVGTTLLFLARHTEKKRKR